MVRRIEAIILAYDLYCRTRGNRVAHGIAVPVVFWALMALAYAVPTTEYVGPYFPNLLTLALPILLLFYASLSFSLAFGLAAFAFFSWGLIAAIDLLAGPVVAWVGTGALWIGLLAIIVGQRAEKRRRRSPRTLAVIHNVRLATFAPLFAPLWLVSLIYRRAAIGY